MKAFQFFGKSTLTFTTVLFVSGAMLLNGCQKSLDNPEQALQTRAMVNTSRNEKVNIPFKANFVAMFEDTQLPAPGVPLIHHLFGTGTGTHIGQAGYDSYVTIDLFGPQPNVGTARATIKAANGDQIFMDQTGTITPDGNGGVMVLITATITGGTGRFENATGELTGTVVSATETTDAVSLEGTISF